MRFKEFVNSQNKILKAIISDSGKKIMFVDRVDAGNKLAEKINLLSNPIVLAIPRGGVVLGDVLAKKFKCKLDIVISKKITPPNHPEYAIGAIMYDGTLYKSEYWNTFCNDLGFVDELKQKQNEAKRRILTYRKNDKYELQNKHVILVDDGVATGSTVFAILKWIKKHNPKKITLSVPVMPSTTLEKIKPLVDDVVVLHAPVDFSSVGQFYDDFTQVSDSTVLDILSKY